MSEREPHQNGKVVSIKYGSLSKLTPYNIDKNSSEYFTMLSTSSIRIFSKQWPQCSLDDGNDQWDNGKAGNHYSNYDAYEQGCTDRNTDGICDNSYSIPGGHNADNLPKASLDAILNYNQRD